MPVVVVYLDNKHLLVDQELKVLVVHYLANLLQGQDLEVLLLICLDRSL